MNEINTFLSEMDAIDVQIHAAFEGPNPITEMALQSLNVINSRSLQRFKILMLIILLILFDYPPTRYGLEIFSLLMLPKLNYLKNIRI